MKKHMHIYLNPSTKTSYHSDNKTIITRTIDPGHNHFRQFPSSDQNSLPTQWWQTNMPSASYFFFTRNSFVYVEIPQKLFCQLGS